MGFLSLNFLFFLVIGAIAVSLARKSRFHDLIFLLVSLLFVGSFLGTWKDAIPLSLFAIFGYRLLLLTKRIRKPWVVPFSLCSLVMLFILLKKYSFLPSFLVIAMPYPLVGLSYVLFRIIHLIHEEAQDNHPLEVTGMGYLQYLFSFLTFVSGPIQKYSDFKKQLDQSARAKPLPKKAAFTALSRIVQGYFKTYVVAVLCQTFHTQVIGYETGDLVLKIVLSSLGMVSYTIYLYFNFSGYMDIVIGAGTFFGFALPENFNHPLKSVSLLDFWTRWHITLSEWFRDYVFNPSAKAMASRSRRSKMALTYIVVAAYFITFLVMGIWHGSTTIFFIYGLFLGIGTSANKWYQLRIRESLGKKRHDKLNTNSVYQALCKGATFSYFSMALTCVWLDYEGWIILFSKLRIDGAVGSFFLMAFVFAGISFFVQWSAKRLGDFLRSVEALFESAFAKHLILGTECYLVLLTMVCQGKNLPEFVYKAF